jgi:hypothetical protein
MEIDSSPVEWMLLSSAADSYCSLSDAVCGLSAQYPEERLSAKYGAVEKALRSLLERRWVDLCRITLSPAGQDGDLHVIDLKSVETVLENPASWYPSYKGIKVVFRPTEAGRQAHRKGTVV